MEGTSPPDAKSLLSEASSTLLGLSIEAQRAAWVYETYINDDTEALTARADARLTSATVEFAHRARAADRPGLPEEVARPLRLLRLSLPVLSPRDPASAEELARLTASMRGRYGKGEHRPAGSTTALDLGEISRRMAASRDPAELLDLWTGWHKVGVPMRPEFVRYVELADRGAREAGFADTGAMWRSKYDMPPDAFAQEVDRLWRQVRPLYRLLHAYARRRLVERYGERIVPPEGPIPSHLLGNMWAQTWEGIYPLLAPPEADPGLDSVSFAPQAPPDHDGSSR